MHCAQTPSKAHHAAPSTGSAAASRRYQNGSLYCTRHASLTALLKECEAALQTSTLAERGEGAQTIAKSCADDQDKSLPPTPRSPTPPMPQYMPPSPPAPLRLEENISAPNEAAPRPYHASPSEASSAVSTWLVWLESCAAAPRCSCLVHGHSTWSHDLFGRFPSVAFFVLPYSSAAGDGIAARVTAEGWTHVYVLGVDLQKMAPRPMRNALLNPLNERLRGLQVL